MKRIQKYIPVKPELKEYMDVMLDLIKDSEIEHVFVHADKAKDIECSIVDGWIQPIANDTTVDM